MNSQIKRACHFNCGMMIGARNPKAACTPCFKRFKKEIDRMSVEYLCYVGYNEGDRLLPQEEVAVFSLRALKKKSKEPKIIDMTELSTGLPLQKTA